MNNTTSLFVTIAVPVLNEEHYIARCLQSLLAQDVNLPGGSGCEILVLDGGSTDRTRDIVLELGKANTAIGLVHNPGRLQSAAVNLAAHIASPHATILLRADAHALYPPGFVAACVNALETTGAPSVVVPMKTIGEGGFQSAVAAVQNCVLGNGASAHRRSGSSGFVDHGHHAAFNREFFLRIGGYNESFTHNEDAEYDHRVASAGGRIWMCGDATLSYFPRSDPWGLVRQYFRHGAGRARTLLAHRIRPRLRQVLPLLILLGWIGGLLLVPINPAFALIPLSYFLICVAFGAVETLRRRDPWMLAMGPAAIIMHLSWACGFVWKCREMIRMPASGEGMRRVRLVTTPPAAETDTGPG